MRKKGKKNSSKPRTRKILLVEDDPLQMMMYQEEISNHGYKVFVAKNSKEAMTLAKQKTLDLIFMDLLLGKENGADIIKSLKKNDKTKDVAIVVLSNYKKEDAKDLCRKNGAIDYLVKSEFVPREIAEKIKIYLDQ